MWPAPRHRPQTAATGRTTEPAVDPRGDLRAWALPRPEGESPAWTLDLDALRPVPHGSMRCPDQACNGQAMFREVMSWSCPCCRTHIAVRRALTL